MMKNGKIVKMLSLLGCVSLLIFSSCSDSPKKDQGNEQEQAQQQDSKMEASRDVALSVNAIGNNMAEIAFEPAELKVPAHSNVKIFLHNLGASPEMIHNFVIVKDGTIKEVAIDGAASKDNGYVKPGDERVIFRSEFAQPGETLEINFQAPAPGVYEFVCTYPGHWAKMKGKFIVE